MHMNMHMQIVTSPDGTPTKTAPKPTTTIRKLPHIYLWLPQSQFDTAVTLYNSADRDTCSSARIIVEAGCSVVIANGMPVLNQPATRRLQV